MGRQVIIISGRLHSGGGDPLHLGVHIHIRDAEMYYNVQQFIFHCLDSEVASKMGFTLFVHLLELRI